MKMFIEGLDSSKPMVSQYYLDNRDIYFIRPVNYAKAHGSAVCSMEKKSEKVTIEAPATLRTGSKHKLMPPLETFLGAADLAESISGSEELSSRKRNGKGYGGVLIAESDSIEMSRGMNMEKMIRGARLQCRRARIPVVRIRKPRIPCCRSRGAATCRGQEF